MGFLSFFEGYGEGDRLVQGLNMVGDSGMDNLGWWNIGSGVFVIEGGVASCGVSAGVSYIYRTMLVSGKIYKVLVDVLSMVGSPQLQYGIGGKYILGLGTNYFFGMADGLGYNLSVKVPVGSSVVIDNFYCYEMRREYE